MNDESNPGEAAPGATHAASLPAAIRDEPLDNKRLLEGIFESWSRGDIRPFIEAMDDEFQWIFPGSWSWSGTWGPKKVVVQNLLRKAISLNNFRSPNNCSITRSAAAMPMRSDKSLWDASRLRSRCRPGRRAGHSCRGLPGSTCGPGFPRR